MTRVVFLAVLLTAGAAVANEAQTDLLESPNEPKAMIGTAWESQYIWRGFDIFRDAGAIDVMADLNLFDTGFGASVVGHQSLGDAFGELQRWDGTLYYQNTLWSGEPLATNFRLGYVYYYYPKTNYGLTQDQMEGHAVLSWPSLLPIQGLQPSFAFAYMWPGAKNPWAESRNPDFDENSTGMFLIGMLDYAFTVPALLAPTEDQVVRLHSELVYNGGVSPFGNNVESGLSDAVIGASTDFVFGADRNLVLTPAIYYQFSLEDTVNPNNEFWASVSLKFAF
jgi:hypothetical protein